MDSVYANVIAYRLNENEFAMEFGDFFPGQANRSEAEFDDFTIRVVMTPSIIPRMIEMLIKAQKESEQHLAAAATKSRDAAQMLAPATRTPAKKTPAKNK